MSVWNSYVFKALYICLFHVNQHRNITGFRGFHENQCQTVFFSSFQTQFFIVTVHNSQFLFMDCSYPWKYVAFIQGFTTIVAILFLNFYIKTYRRNPRDAAKKKQSVSNGYHANGHLETNGERNGHISNGYIKPKDLKRRNLHS